MKLFMFFILLLVCFFSITYKEGLNLRKKKYNSFFERNNIQNNKEKSILSFKVNGYLEYIKNPCLLVLWLLAL